MINAGKIVDSIQEKINTNIVIQIQSYGRVFIFDQLGEIVCENDAICVRRSDYPHLDTDSMILKALKLLKDKIEEQNE